MKSSEHSSEAWIDATAAIEAAELGIHNLGLTRDPAVVHTTKSGYPASPFLVERLDKPGNAYYLIPWVVTEGVVFLANVDAVSGVMLGVTTFPRPVSSPLVTPDEAVNLAVQKFPRRAFGKPRLVWQPCRESTSPTRPFYQILSDEGTLYVDMDGSILPELTPLGLGGRDSK